MSCVTTSFTGRPRSSRGHPRPDRKVRYVRDGSGDPGPDVIRLTPSVPVAMADAAEAVANSFGLTAELDRLPGEADDNFVLRAGDGRRYVVKIAHLQADPRV